MKLKGNFYRSMLKNISTEKYRDRMAELMFVNIEIESTIMLIHFVTKLTKSRVLGICNKKIQFAALYYHHQLRLLHNAANEYGKETLI